VVGTWVAFVMVLLWMTCVIGAEGRSKSIVDRRSDSRR